MSNALQPNGARTPAPRPARREATRAAVEVSHEDAARLRSAVSRIGKGLRATAAGGGLSPSALDALGTVVRRGPIRPSDLAALEALNPTMLSRLVGRLEDDELVQRIADAEDGRSYSLVATDPGRRMHERVLAERAEVLMGVTARLGPDERSALVAALPVLETLAEVLRSDPAPPSAANGEAAAKRDRHGTSRSATGGRR